MNDTPRTPLDSIAYALCTNDESGNPDYGNDYQARLIYDQLIADGHLASLGSDGAPA